MIKRFHEAIIRYFTKESELNIKLFKILGITGVTVSIIAGIESMIAGGTAKNGAIIDFLAAGMAILLLWFVEQSGKYVIGYLITVVTVFMGLFSVLFFKGGGMDGSIPFFFVFGIVFSFMMFDGILLAIVGVIEMAYYTFICIFSIKHPEFVTPFESVNAGFVDKITGIIISGLGLGFMFLIYIGEYKKQQKLAEEANHAKSLFLANISHDIRSPINMMLNMNKMVMHESENELIKEYALNAYDAGNQLMFMVNQLLDLSRLEKGSEVLAETDYDFYKAMDNLVGFFREEAEKKGLGFVFEDDKTIERFLFGDIRKITRLITNLCSNAVKYTDKGMVKLSIKNCGVKEGTQKLRFEISDTGIGIKREDLVRIFDSFERTESVKVRSVEGSGLGLAISAELAKTLGSAIEVDSEYGKGSTFSFELTQRLGEKSAVVDEEKTKTVSFIAPEAKVLVVDDNSMNLYVMKALLKKTLIEVDTAGSAGESLKKCREKKYDLIFMDYMMPGVDGIEALNQIRNADNKNRDTKVFVLTADASPGTKEMLLSKGFEGYLSKPVDGDYMENVILSSIPESLVQKQEADLDNEITDEEKEEYKNLLAKYDVIFEEGLRFVSYDVSQYAKVCTFFLRSVEEGIAMLCNCAKEGDLEGVAARCHSLKGNARNVGSVELYSIAKNLEKHARANDTDYVITVIPVLKLEWERAKEGLHIFLDMYIVAHPDGEETKDYIKKEALNELKKQLMNYKQSPSLKLISIMKKEETDEEQLRLLSDIERSVTEIEFDEALALMAGLKDGE